MRNIFSLDLKELKEVLHSLGYPPFQGDNVYRWLYLKRIFDFQKMTDLPSELREYLSSNFFIGLPVIVERVQATDGTTKFLMELEDGERVEAVLIPEKGHTTFCISSQVGCRMGCKFCATALSGLIRNLRFYEITGQILRLMEHTENRINIVFMGMGEPLDNMDEVSKAIEIMNKWMGISPRRMTLSTVGLVDKLKTMLVRFPNLRVALSLNFSDDERRSKFMPINRKYSIGALVEALKRLPIKRRERVTIEYVLVDRINDSAEDAERLGKLLRGLKVKVNLIPYNENEFFPWKRPEDKKVEKFANRLRAMGYSVFVRFSKGNEIKAACGQLRAQRGQGT